MVIIDFWFSHFFFSWCGVGITECFKIFGKQTKLQMIFYDCAGGALSLLGNVQFELQKLIDSYVSICRY